MANNGKIAFGAIIGAAAGLIAGVLTAPKSGKETRADIKTKAAELKDKADETSQAAKDRALDLKARAESSVNNAVDGAKSGFKK